jgi:hypothetical protein
MKKYSIVINHIGNDLYAIVIKKFDIIDGVVTNEISEIHTNKTLVECITIQNNSIDNYGL